MNLDEISRDDAANFSDTLLDKLATLELEIFSIHKFRPINLLREDTRQKPGDCQTDHTRCDAIVLVKRARTVSSVPVSVIPALVACIYIISTT